VVITVSGVIHGRRIDLEQDASLPDGTAVMVRLEAQVPSLEERRSLVAATAGSWASDSRMDEMFEEIVSTRRSDLGRTVRFDDPA
jgi:hypothetical protein